MGYVFDGINKIISLTAGTTILDVRDIYSRWKDWVRLVGSKYQQTFSVVGGDPIDITQGIYVTSYFFLQNSWKIRPQEASHKLTVNNGVLVTSDGTDPFVSTIGSYNVMIQYSQPIKSETIATGGGGGGGQVTSFSAGALTQVVDAGNSAGWNASGGGTDLSGISGQLVDISGQLTLNNSIISTVSGNVNTILNSGVQLTPSALSQIITSGNAFGWDGNLPIPEITSDPGATPTLNQASMLKYMELRNQRTQEDPTIAGKFYFMYNNAGHVLASGSIFDNPTLGIFTKGKLIF